MHSPYFSPKHQYRRASPGPPAPFTNQKITSAIKPYESELGLPSRYNDSTSIGTGLTGIEDPEFQKKVIQRKQRGADAMQELITTFKNEKITKDDLMRKIEEVHFSSDKSEEFQNSQAWENVRAAQALRDQREVKYRKEVPKRGPQSNSNFYSEESERVKLMELKKYYFQEYLKLKEKCQEFQENFYKIDKLMNELDSKSQLSSPKSTSAFALHSPRSVYQNEMPFSPGHSQKTRKQHGGIPISPQTQASKSPSLQPSIRSHLNFDYVEYQRQKKEKEIGEYNSELKRKLQEKDSSKRMKPEKYEHLMRAKEMIVKREKEKRKNEARISIGSGSPRLKTLTEQTQSTKSKGSPLQASSPSMKKYRSSHQLRGSSEMLTSSGYLKETQVPERHFRVPSDTSEFDSEIVNHERVYQPEKKIKVYPAQLKLPVSNYPIQASPVLGSPTNTHAGSIHTQRSPKSGETTKRSNSKPPLATKSHMSSKISLKKLQKEGESKIREESATESSLYYNSQFQCSQPLSTQKNPLRTSPEQKQFCQASCSFDQLYDQIMEEKENKRTEEYQSQKTKFDDFRRNSVRLLERNKPKDGYCTPQIADQIINNIETATFKHLSSQKPSPTHYKISSRNSLINIQTSRENQALLAEQNQLEPFALENMTLTLTSNQMENSQKFSPQSVAQPSIPGRIEFRHHRSPKHVISTISTKTSANNSPTYAYANTQGTGSSDFRPVSSRNKLSDPLQPYLKCYKVGSQSPRVEQVERRSPSHPRKSKSRKSSPLLRCESSHSMSRSMKKMSFNDRQDWHSRSKLSRIFSATQKQFFRERSPSICKESRRIATGLVDFYKRNEIFLNRKENFMIANTCKKDDESLFTPQINQSSRNLKPEDRLRIAKKVQEKHEKRLTEINLERHYQSRSKSPQLRENFHQQSMVPSKEARIRKKRHTKAKSARATSILKKSQLAAKLRTALRR